MQNQQQKLAKLQERRDFNRQLKLIPATSKMDLKTFGTSVESLTKAIDGSLKTGNVAINLRDVKDANFSIAFANSKSAAKQGRPAKADFELTTDSGTWQQIASGKLNAIVAVYLGKVELHGDLEIAKKMLAKAGIIDSAESINF